MMEELVVLGFEYIPKGAKKDAQRYVSFLNLPCLIGVLRGLHSLHLPHG
jgi:hypothetical protein